MTPHAPSDVPIYESDAERQMLWERDAGNDQPVVAIRNARRGWIVRYDLAHLDAELRPETLQRLRDSVGDRRPYPTGTDPISQAEGVGGEAGPVSGDLHESSEEAARELAAHVSTFVFDRSKWA
ncbi:hypothetical protein [Halapricum hydrolyticum]|uniref:Uncharacterized protein n=1 Tax=Halapricum hydrolyticum TaxID=2979991 RepID=A0AAE3LEJ5_9EURY|nr:hypothetical protein [Halapricum hydrolyticum]MCU4718405.1 hypothetical protein [Halapricum hydrolyticum]MCU4726482.1 hypothetical protein [Halapricum hydrolyticum]